MSQPSDTDMPVAPPDTTTEILRGPAPQPPVPLVGLGELVHLIGSWNSPSGADATGFNVMSLPQASSSTGYILKNLPYYEEITFATLSGTAPNRGGEGVQNCNGLCYEQRVFIAPGPGIPASYVNTLVHFENGTWLHLVLGPQKDGAFPPAPPFPPSMNQPTTLQYVKQVSVPHGNSILAQGSATAIPIVAGKGQPVFPVAPRNMLPFTDPAVPDPTLKLQEQLDQLARANITITSGTMITVTDGDVANIPFEQAHATVDAFTTTWYIEQLSNGTTQLQYTQRIDMKLLIKGELVPFVHIDANSLTRVAGSAP